MIALVALAAGVALAEPPLQPWSALVGHCWSGPAPGNSGTDRHCFESVYGGQHVRDRHTVTVAGREVYAGESLYSAKGSHVIFTYWNSLGGLGTGEAVVGGKTWTFTGTIHATASGAEEPMRAEWTIVPGGYQVREGSEPPRLFRRAD
ncbi:hypothetical protein [Sphingomonas sp.]|uniref:hypothetical protein n=1 Tax=Sphingomonas sp. TaxID=28214 RepID=UPI0025DA518C|nr:hypothetical protein [Sphingomonas sp.]MBV9527762.1 hypothetical protein [Sphingomonas sp.]